MSLPIDQIDSSRTKPPQLEHDGQPSSGRVLPSTLTASQRGPVTLLRLSRPAQRNALDEATIAGLETFFSGPPKETRVVVLFGEGKHFSAGGDLHSFADTTAWDRVLFSETWHRAFDRIEEGKIEFHVEDHQVETVGPGETIFLPKGKAHEWRRACYRGIARRGHRWRSGARRFRAHPGG